MNNPTMLTYINQEASVMTKILDTYPQQIDAVIDSKLLTSQSWLLLGIGSSYNAALSAKYYIEEKANVLVDLQQPYNYSNYDMVDPNLEVAVGISQSGQSTSTIDAIKKLSEENIYTIGVTSQPGKELSDACQRTLDILTGREQVGYVSLGFTATVLSLMLLGLRVGVKKGLISIDQESTELEEFRNIVAHFDETITKTTDFFKENESDFQNAYQFSGIAYGPSVGSIKELETKFTETVRVPADGNELEAFMHGPYLSINPEHRLFFITTNAKPNVKSKADSLIRYESQYTKHIFEINYTDQPNNSEKVLNLMNIADETKVPFLGGLPIQVLSWYITKSRGIDLSKQIFTDFSEKVHNKTEFQNYV
jgi:Glucosamine 6-phosphate synthetase, contains amidotransferase and phosphosugar isomerase domains